MKERKKKKIYKRKRQRENRRTFSGWLWWLLWLFFGGDVFGLVGAVVVVGVRVFRQTLRRVARCRCSLPAFQVFPFWRSFGRRLLLLAVMVFFYPPEYKKAVAICQRLKV